MVAPGALGVANGPGFVLRANIGTYFVLLKKRLKPDENWIKTDHDMHGMWPTCTFHVRHTVFPLGENTIWEWVRLYFSGARTYIV